MTPEDFADMYGMWVKFEEQGEYFSLEIPKENDPQNFQSIFEAVANFGRLKPGCRILVFETPREFCFILPKTPIPVLVLETGG